MPHYREATWQWQEKRYASRLADRTPIVRGKTCRWARYAATEHQGRSIAAHERFVAWWNDVGAHVRRLDAGLAGSPMAGTGALLERYGRMHGVSPYFMAAVAAKESTLGRAMCLDYNAWGLSACGRAWTPPSFDSWEESIAYFARYLEERWGRNHSSPYSFGSTYCPGCGSWPGDVSGFMSSLFGVGSSTRYP